MVRLTDMTIVVYWDFKQQNKQKQTGRGSSIGSVSAWHASGPEFDLHIRHIFSWKFSHEKNSTTILPLPLVVSYWRKNVH